MACAAAEPRTSLVPQTLEEMEGDEEGRALAARLSTEGQAVLTREERRARQRSLDALGVPPFLAVARVRIKHPSPLFAAFKASSSCPIRNPHFFCLWRAVLPALAGRPPSCKEMACAATRLVALKLYTIHSATDTQERGVTPLRRNQASTLQLNIGLYCNQACSHCHVESSPLRKEAMDSATAARCIELLRR